MTTDACWGGAIREAAPSGGWHGWPMCRWSAADRGSPAPCGRSAVNIAASLFDVAARQPQLPAVSDGVHAWTYGEFAHRVSCLAGGLRARGLEPGDRVMLCMENCAEFLEMLFACWAAGLCAVPVNARLHPAEVAHIAQDSRARLL